MSKHTTSNKNAELEKKIEVLELIKNNPQKFGYLHESDRRDIDVICTAIQSATKFMMLNPINCEGDDKKVEQQIAEVNKYISIFNHIPRECSDSTLNSAVKFAFLKGYFYTYNTTYGGIKSQEPSLHKMPEWIIEKLDYEAAKKLIKHGYYKVYDSFNDKTKENLVCNLIKESPQTLKKYPDVFLLMNQKFGRTGDMVLSKLKNDAKDYDEFKEYITKNSDLFDQAKKIKDTIEFLSNRNDRFETAMEEYANAIKEYKEQTKLLFGELPGLIEDN